MKYIDTVHMLLNGCCNGSSTGHAYFLHTLHLYCLLEQWSLAFLGALLKA
jgi:hypothetical protein